MLIRLEKIEKTYRMGEVEVPALRGVSLEVGDGEFVAVMGASGSGKSTLMNLIGCLDHPSRGRYLLEDRDVSMLDKRALARIRNQKIGFVFQSFNLLQRTTALENIALPLLYSGVPHLDRTQRSGDLLRMVGLAERAEHYPSQLSGGQQQRVAIARALVNEPRILLADEPTGNLDSASSREIMEILKTLNVKRGLTVILVTHEQEIAAYAGRMLFLKDGQLLRDERVTRGA